MKRLVLAIIVLFTITISASAMSYAQAREQALFLTDKMAYELDLPMNSMRLRMKLILITS